MKTITGISLLLMTFASVGFAGQQEANQALDNATLKYGVAAAANNVASTARDNADLRYQDCQLILAQIQANSSASFFYNAGNVLMADGNEKKTEADCDVGDAEFYLTQAMQFYADGDYDGCVAMCQLAIVRLEWATSDYLEAATLFNSASNAYSQAIFEINGA